MNSIVIRPAVDRDLPSVAGLRWRWLLENDGTPTTTHDEFVQWFAHWAQANISSHRCLVVADDGEVIGMGWLAITQRVPTPRLLERASGDVQCVYLVPDRRGTGLGSELIDALTELARQLGLERVTVHSSPRAVPAYSRRGFAVSNQLLQTSLNH
ncbi:GNAT family N-acetyltransferase [Nocardia terpenica]|uniref:Acetyltransferase n=1 Tax=Nocardia terpenica TaxID=455432 RepID=A0A164HIB5_9NOCA|nr:GNAT family N-acetyltransferase [Nocardia terpenica]KZM68539.1 acetyltransferase [Nocardia terpenica]NQE88503.1 GNAT family N-acetyltransferase [Nocardia terpenica]